jgi:hypothetical protein
MRSAHILGSAGLVLFALACDDVGPTKLASDMIGPDGGVATSSDGRIRLEIPRNALTQPIHRELFGRLPDHEDARLLKHTRYGAGISSLSFGRNARIEIDYDRAHLGEHVAESELAVRRTVVRECHAFSSFCWPMEEVEFLPSTVDTARMVVMALTNVLGREYVLGSARPLLQVAEHATDLRIGNTLVLRAVDGHGQPLAVDWAVGDLLEAASEVSGRSELTVVGRSVGDSRIEITGRGSTARSSINVCESC